MNQLENSPFVFACPVCRGKLVNSANGLCCLVDELTFICEEKIWRFLPPGRAAALAQFRQEYEAVRRSEGRGSSDPAFYRALPFVVKNQQISQIKPIGSQRKSIQSFGKNGW